MEGQTSYTDSEFIRHKGAFYAKAQSVNFLVYFFIFSLSIFIGKDILVLYAFSLGFIQVSVFFIFLFFQFKYFIKGLRHKVLHQEDLIIHAYPVITFVGMSVVLGGFQHFEPFRNDNYKVEAEFYKNGTCTVYFEGKQRSKVDARYDYNWGCGYGISLSCPTSEGHFSLYLSKLPHKTTLPMKEKITHKGRVDSLGQFGAAFFDDEVTLEYSPDYSNVYWNLFSGSARIESAEFNRPEITSYCGASNVFARIKGKFSGRAKRVFRGP